MGKPAKIASSKCFVFKEPFCRRCFQQIKQFSIKLIKFEMQRNSIGLQGISNLQDGQHIKKVEKF